MSPCVMLGVDFDDDVCKTQVVNFMNDVGDGYDDVADLEDNFVRKKL